MKFYVLFALGCCALLVGCAAMTDLADSAADATYDVFGVPSSGDLSEIGNRPTGDGVGIGWGEGGVIGLASMLLLHTIRNFTRRRLRRELEENAAGPSSNTTTAP